MTGALTNEPMISKDLIEVGPVPEPPTVATAIEGLPLEPVVDAVEQPAPDAVPALVNPASLDF